MQRGLLEQTRWPITKHDLIIAILTVLILRSSVSLYHWPYCICTLNQNLSLTLSIIWVINPNHIYSDYLMQHINPGFPLYSWSKIQGLSTFKDHKHTFSRTKCGHYFMSLPITCYIATCKTACNQVEITLKVKKKTPNLQMTWRGDLDSNFFSKFSISVFYTEYVCSHELWLKTNKGLSIT